LPATRSQGYSKSQFDAIVEGRVSAAAITHTAADESAKLQAIAAVVRRIGSKIGQDIEHGMEMRY